jgi:transposase
VKRFIEGECRTQAALFPERLDEWVGDDNSVRAVDAFVDELDFKALGFDRADPAVTGRPAYHRRRCSRSTSTAISTVCNRVVGSSARLSATLS